MQTDKKIPMKNTFKNWLRSQAGRNDQVGDVARFSITADHMGYFEKAEKDKDVLDVILLHCDYQIDTPMRQEAMQAFQEFEIWKEYQESMEDDVIAEVAKDRSRSWRSIRQAVREWAESMPEDFRKSARMRFLREQRKRISERIDENSRIQVELSATGPAWIVPMLEASMERLEKDMKKVILEMKIVSGVKKAAITPEMVDRAREYPLDRIVEVGRDKRAKCVFHGGEDMNMDIRKNFAYCYVCNGKGDAIDVFMKVNGVGFKEAVLAMQ